MSRWICIRARQDHGSLSCTNKTREKIELFFSQTELLFAFPHLTNVHNVLSNDAKEVATQVTVATVLITPTERITIHSEYEDNDALKDSSQTGLTLINGLSLCALRFVTALSLSPSSLSSPSHFPSARSNNLSSKPNGSNPSSLFFFCAHSVSPLKNTTTPPLPDTLAVILNNGAPVAGRGLAVAVREVQWRKQSWQFVHISSFILQSQSIVDGSGITDFHHVYQAPISSKEASGEQTAENDGCEERLPGKDVFQRRNVLVCWVNVEGVGEMRCQARDARDQVPMSKHRRHSVLLIISARFVGLQAVTTVIREEGSCTSQRVTTFVWSSGFLFAVASLLRLDVRIRGCQCRCGFLQAKDRFEMCKMLDQAIRRRFQRIPVIQIGLEQRLNIRDVQSFDCLNHLLHLLDIVVGLVDVHLQASSSSLSRFAILSASVSAGTTFDVMSPAVLHSFRAILCLPPATTHTTSSFFFPFLIPPFPRSPLLFTRILVFLSLGFCFSSLLSFILFRLFFYSADTCTLWSQFDFDGPILAIMRSAKVILPDELVGGPLVSSSLALLRLLLLAPNSPLRLKLARSILSLATVYSRLPWPSFLPEAVPLVGLGVAVAVNTPVSATVLVPLLPLLLQQRASVLHCSDPTSRCWLLGQWRVCISAIDDTSEDGKGSLRLIEWHHVSRVVDSAEREIAKLAHSTSDITRVNDDIRIACTVPARECTSSPYIRETRTPERRRVGKRCKFDLQSGVLGQGAIFALCILLLKVIGKGWTICAAITLSKEVDTSGRDLRAVWSNTRIVLRKCRQETLEEMPCSSGRDIGGIACGHWVARAEKNDDHVDIAEFCCMGCRVKGGRPGGVLYAMVIFSLMGDLRMFEYWTGGGNCASTSNEQKRFKKADNKNCGRFRWTVRKRQGRVVKHAGKHEAA
ncbi:hypothetical protein KCU99_g316, partial [Aureobasidium melanogenum]